MDIYKGSAKASALTLCCSALITPGIIMANELPVYHVVDEGVSESQLYQISKSLRIDPELIDWDSYRRTGAVSFIDPATHQHIPTRVLGGGKPDEEQKETRLEAIDFEALSLIQPIDEYVVLHQLETSLHEVGLLPEAYKPYLQHTQFEAVDRRGAPLAKALIDTKASLRLYANDLPLIGPGAKISATVDAGGTTTQFRFANRALKRGEYVSVIDHSQAKRRCEQRVLTGDQGKLLDKLNVTAELVYYAPSMDITSVETILPHYDCGGTAVVGGEIVDLLHETIPAVDSAVYIPQAVVIAKVDGGMINAQVNIEGGMPPYQIQWSADRVKTLDRTGSVVIFPVQTRKEVGEAMVTVKVTDANGIETLANTTITLPKISAKEKSPIVKLSDQAITQVIDFLVPAAEAVGGVTDYGTENAVTNQFGNLEQGFINRMQAGGVVERFSWSGTLAWEQDFKSTQDTIWIDNTDITFYSGHGYGGGFTFEDTTHDDSTLDYNDATDDWGDRDLEWLALLSCQVLKDSWAGMSHFTRWKQEFDGLHLLLGFHTYAYAWMSFSGEFADNMLKFNPMRVRTAWFQATNTDQPANVQPVVMGVLGMNWISNVNDYFWGKGPVGPDIRDGNIIGYWSIRML